MRLITLFIFSSFSLLLNAQDSKFCDLSGCVGDVKYSVLKPDTFRKINGKGWILLNGNADVENDTLFSTSLLHNISKLPSLPDARGVFVRGMNMGRDTLTGDANGNRSVGDFQFDQLKRHSHGYPEVYYNGQIVGHGDWHMETKIRGDTRTKEEGGNETRPRNISLYIYIKIN